MRRGKKNMLTIKALHTPDDTNEKGFQDSSPININELGQLEFLIKRVVIKLNFFLLEEVEYFFG